jgi:hypothetical protein
MATLRKVMKDTKNFYEVTVVSTKGADLLAGVHEVKKPEEDELTQILVYSFDNDWKLHSNYNNAYDELMRLFNSHLNVDELDAISDMSKVTKHISKLAEEISNIVKGDVELILISKNGERYELDVTSQDIRKIFLSYI